MLIYGLSRMVTGSENVIFLCSFGNRVLSLCRLLYALFRFILFEYISPVYQLNKSLSIYIFSLYGGMQVLNRLHLQCVHVSRSLSVDGMPGCEERMLPFICIHASMCFDTFGFVSSLNN